jgi:murein DD-endopeptidase MepM/ murein hydrolase activator NlpD
LIGIDLGTKPGRHVIKVTAVHQGKSIAADYPLAVEEKEFPTRRLTVDSKFVNPPKEVLPRISRESKRVQNIFAAVTPGRLWAGAFQAPVPGPPISAFGKRNIMNGEERSPHTGTDFKGAAGTPIHAPNSGRIVLVADLYYSGNTVIIDHGQGLYSYFAHLSRFSGKEGDEIKTGDIVGYVGQTGRVTGPHLHWTVRLMRTRVDPLSLMAVSKN